MYLVNGVSKYTSFSVYNISLDQYFRPVSLAILEIETQLALVGTTRLDRKDIPKEIKSLEHREKKSKMYVNAEDQNIMLAS